LRSLAIRVLPRMFPDDGGLFAFRLRRDGGSDRLEGVSPRYTAIVLIAAATESPDVVNAILKGRDARTVCDHLIDAVSRTNDIGEAALALWAARLHAHDRAREALARVRSLDPVEGRWPTVEVAWCLTALTATSAVTGAQNNAGDESLATRIAARLLASFHRESGMFSHWPSGASGGGIRAHVACFADLVYPIQALSNFYQATGTDRAIDAARRCAATMCALQGQRGQWWWHFDVRTAKVVERYPVYAVHQDAMGPMALFSLEDATGEAHHDAVRKSIEWLATPVEIKRSLIDSDADVIWRKVARREPGKLSRSTQAVASRLHPSLRAPLTDTIFPPVRIDFESRPYHMGWILHAFSESRMARLTAPHAPAPTPAT